MKEKVIRVGFCENGAGYGGAIISLAAFLEKIPHRFLPHIYTGLATDDYQQLEKYGAWRHVPSLPLINRDWLIRKKIPHISLIDNVCNLLPHTLRFYRWFKKDKLDIVYLNNDPSCNLAAALAAKFAGIPFMLHARGFSGDTKGNRWVLANLDHCVAVSNAVKDELSSLGLPAEKCEVVPEGLDLSLFYPRSTSVELRCDLGFNSDAPVITLVGGLIDWKGQDVLLQACPLIFEKFPAAQILLVGSAYGKDNSFAAMIAEQARRPELQGRVHLLGSRNDIPELLSLSTIVLHTSTKPEPFGRTFLEGMAMGKPVIASNEGGPSEVIEDSVDGLLIQPRDPQLLAASIIRLLSDRIFADTLGKNAARKAMKYSIESHAAAIVAALEKIGNFRIGLLSAPPYT